MTLGACVGAIVGLKLGTFVGSAEGLTLGSQIEKIKCKTNHKIIRYLCRLEYNIARQVAACEKKSS